MKIIGKWWNFSIRPQENLIALDQSGDYICLSGWNTAARRWTRCFFVDYATCALKNGIMIFYAADPSRHDFFFVDASDVEGVPA